VQESIDAVNIFRPSNEVLQIVKEAIAKKAKAVWMQEGIKNEEAAREARKHGLLVVMDRCMMKEHKLRKRGGARSAIVCLLFVFFNYFLYGKIFLHKSDGEKNQAQNP